MLKKTITYTDYDGNQRTEDFYFNLSKAEVTEMELSAQGGLSKMLEKIIASQDSKRIMEIFKDIILKAYGEKSGDGKRFIKNQELRDAFVQTEAYSELFMELATNADSAAAFINGIIPSAK
jgi:nitrogen regulatory protein PII